MFVSYYYYTTHKYITYQNRCNLTINVERPFGRQLRQSAVIFSIRFPPIIGKTGCFKHWLKRHYEGAEGLVGRV